MYINDPYTTRPAEVVSRAYGDVNGDGVIDCLLLTGVKQDPSSPYVEQITLHIQDGRTNQVYTIALPENGGYGPTMFLGDFTADGVLDILITIDSGGSGALTYNYIYSFVNNHARQLFDTEQYNEQNQFTVTYLDNYKIRVHSPATGQSYLIDISERGADYLSQIYRDDGTLKEPVEGMADGVSGFYPVDMDRNGVCEIQAYHRISGLYHADSFGYIINSLQWDGQKFVIWQQWFAMYGNEQQ